MCDYRVDSWDRAECVVAAEWVDGEERIEVLRVANDFEWVLVDHSGGRHQSKEREGHLLLDEAQARWLCAALAQACRGFPGVESGPRSLPPTVPRG